MQYRIHLILVLIVTMFPSVIRGQEIVINELMSSNSYIPDEDGDYPDWFELYNAGQDTVDLNGFGLSNDLSVPFQWIIPEVILTPHEYLLIFASKKNRTDISSGYLHTDF